MTGPVLLEGAFCAKIVDRNKIPCTKIKGTLANILESLSCQLTHVRRSNIEQYLFETYQDYHGLNILETEPTRRLSNE